MVHTYSTICMFFMLPSFLEYGRSLAVDFLMMTTVMIVRYLCGVTWWCWDTHWPQYENQPTPVVSQATPSLFLSANCLLILEVISTEEQKQSGLWDYIWESLTVEGPYRCVYQYWDDWLWESTLSFLQFALLGNELESYAWKRGYRLPLI